METTFSHLSSGLGLQGAELTCRCTDTGAGVAVKEACRVILAFLRSLSANGCEAPGRAAVAMPTALPTDTKVDVFFQLARVSTSKWFDAGAGSGSFNPPPTGGRRAVEVNRSEPFEGRLAAPLLADVDLLDQVQAGQYVCDVVQSAHLSCRQEDVKICQDFGGGGVGSPLTAPAHAYFCTCCGWTSPGCPQ